MGQQVALLMEVSWRMLQSAIIPFEQMDKMRALTFAQRTWIAVLILIGTAVLTSPLLFWHWITALVALIIDLAVGWGVSAWLSRFVTEQHGHFLAALKDLRASVHTGRRSLMLKSDRPADSFGLMAVEINGLVKETAEHVSHQLEQNRSLEQNKTLFQSILGTMIEGVLVLDAERRVLYFNDAARQVLGCSDRHVEGRPLWEVLRAADLNEAIDAVYESGREFRKELELKRSKSVVEITAVQLPLSPRPGVVVVLHEVTELRSLERMRREFVSNVSHELKTPLTSIQAYADTLLEGGLADEENNRKFVERILEQSDRLQALIQDMLRLARIESQSEAFQLRPVSLTKILESCTDARLAVARSRQIELKLTSTSPPVQVMADPSGLQTIFDNLISNALNYSREGGHVGVRWQVSGGEVQVEVQDDGIGVAHEHHERIFERFYRVDKARSRGAGGTGLGLSIVKHLTTVFGGRIEVISEPGQGSIFRVTLPVVSQSAQSIPPVGSPSAVPTKPHDAF
ncbi:sensor histidine kinase [Planctomicrobium sp. SH661]|uniref:sensor histidine kinase n=1 Tax=Planctomicrobium sp. SH661 TaxID=3448124 RepID=UPI003F5B7B18